MLLIVLSVLCPAASLALVAKGSVSVCSNKHCRKDGSLQTQRLFEDLTRGFQKDFTVETCGCCGKCGSGPNIQTSTGSGYSGVIKPATVAALLSIDFDIEVPDSVVDAMSMAMEADKLRNGNQRTKPLGMFRKAFDDCDDIASFPGVAAFIHTGLAECQLAAGKPEEAILEARAALALDPGRTAAWWCLRDSLVLLGQIQKALDTLQDMISQVPDTARGTVIGDAVALCGGSDGKDAVDHELCQVI